MKRLSIFWVLLVLVSTQLACSFPITQATTATPAETPLAPTFTAPATETLSATETLPPAATPAASRISLEVLKNFTYFIEDFNTQVTLKDGVFSDDKLQVHLIEPAAFGDLNSDGQPDAAVILAIKSGGTGTFYNLIALLDQDGTPVQAGFSYVGDRQRVIQFEIAASRVILDYFTQGLSDPLCCPSEHRLRSYLLENSALKLASEQVLDSPTTQATPLPNAILIDRPVKGDPLTTPLQVSGRVSQVPPEKKLTYAVTDLNATLLMQGEVTLEGEPGGPGSFTFEFSLGAVSPGLIQVELVDAANGSLRGRSIVVLVTQ